MIKKMLTVAVLLFAAKSFSQKAPINWYLKDPNANSIYGTGVEQAYKLLAGKTPQTVIVAVIDSGVETDHPDLKDVIWVNEDEIPGNGIDDDNNGYVDDVHGWSFLGGAKEDIDHEALELARMYRVEKRYFSQIDTTSLQGADKTRYQEYLKLKADFVAEQSKLEQQYMNISLLSGYIKRVKDQQGGVFSKKTNKKYQAPNDMDARIKKRLKTILLIVKASELEKQITEGGEAVEGMLKYNKIDMDSVRRVIVGDDPYNMNERFYGCNRYEGPDAMHGTHVSGIIAGVRGNGIGIDGIAANAKIMVVRAVPNGDERDKDIANAIRYAVDNGAKVINMSFGKYYTPNKSVVDEAIQYAKSKDVLLVHAAGNDAKNKDVEDSYPTRKLNDGTIATNWIEVGASSSSKKGDKLLADFSNYGATTVDLFAPGVDIYSTVPNAAYEDASGTSMACPATAGVAAVIRGYFPELTAEQVKEVLMKTVVTYDKDIVIPGTKNKAKMKDACITGGFVNTAKAVEYLLKGMK